MRNRVTCAMKSCLFASVAGSPLLLATVLGNSSPAFAASGAETSLEEITVTAQKRAERLHDVPISISVLTGAALDASTSQGVIDALNRIPGVVAAPPSIYGGSQVAIRGVAAGAAALNSSSPIAYYLDAVPFGLCDQRMRPTQTPTIWSASKCSVVHRELYMVRVLRLASSAFLRKTRISTASISKLALVFPVRKAEG